MRHHLTGLQSQDQARFLDVPVTTETDSILAPRFIFQDGGISSPQALRSCMVGRLSPSGPTV